MKNTFILRRPFPYKYKRCVLGIILINIICFLGSIIYPRLQIYLSLNPGLVIYYKMYWQFVSYMFMHHDMSHIFFNMLGLLIFGMQVEKTIGSTEFVVFYLLSGFLSGVFSFCYYVFMGQNVSLIGASGAVYAVMFAYAVLYPRSIIYIWGLIPVPAPILVLVYTIVELVSGLYSLSSNVAHYTHLFGFFSAWLYFVIRMGIHPIKIWKKIYKE